MKKFEGWQVILVLVLLALICVELQISSSSSSSLRDQTNGYMNYNWTVSVNGTVYDDVKLSSFKLYDTKRGDVITLTNRMTYKQIEHPVLRLYGEFACIDVFLDGERVYTYGHERYEHGRLVGYGRHVFETGEGYQGKVIEIVFTVARDNGVTSFEAPILCDGFTVHTDYIRDTIFIYLLDIFLVVFGMIVILCTILTLRGNPIIKELFCVGAFSLFIGVWSFCEYNYFSIVSDNYTLKNYLEYFALYTAPIYIFAYFGVKSGSHMSKGWHIGYRVVFSLYTVSYVVGNVLSVLRLMQFTEFLPVTHIFIVLMGLFVIAFMLRGLIKKEKEYPAFLTGMTIMVAFALFTLFGYSVTNYLGEKNTSYSGMATYASFILVLSMLFDLGHMISEKIKLESRMELFEQLAYKDFLTDLANRRQCELVLDELSESNTAWAVISLDINGLKETNDNYGHDEGDALLKDFAMILKEVFGPIGVIVRMGGDEFAVIIKNTEGLSFEHIFSMFDKRCEEVSAEREHYSIVSARGMCTSEEGFMTVREAMLEADDRMYENKAKLKGKAYRNTK